MKRILILITLMIFGGEAAAQCNYPSGSTTKRQGLSSMILAIIHLFFEFSFPQYKNLMKSHKIHIGCY